jgi:hypothetical protein
MPEHADKAIGPQPLTTQPPPRRTLRKRLALLVVIVLLAYVTLTYVFIPFGWKRYASRHPELEDVPRITYTASGIPGDPLNVELIGPEKDLKEIMSDAHWHPADRLGLRSDVKIAEATVLKRPYADAPVSNLYLGGRKEDLAFEKPVGDDPRQRHHVRFWRSSEADQEGRTVWLGSVTYDKSVGFSHTTGQITHHIGPDIDAERDHLFHDLEQTGRLSSTDVVDGFHTILQGRNGGGDPWETDGRLFVGILKAE